MILKFKKHSFIFNDILSLIIVDKYLLVRTEEKTVSIWYSQADLNEMRSTITTLNEIRQDDINILANNPDKRKAAKYAEALNIFMFAGGSKND